MLISHLGISTSEAGWRSLPFCPTKGKVKGKHLLFSGTTGVSFMVEMQQEGGIQLDDPVTVKLSANDTYPAVYQFTPTKDISSTQLDITATSESDDVPAYLKVSRDCKDVKENIEVVDYKGESLRLSFAKKGRITLSKFSIPPLTASTSSWFIGIAIKNASGDTPIDVRKIVTLTLKRSFDYTYTDPLLGLFLGCGLGGIGISWVAWIIFRKRTFCCCSQEENPNPNPNPNPKQENKPKITCYEFFSAMLAVLCRYTLVGGPKTYSYITLIVGWVFMVGSFQFVFADWYLMIQEGDRDHCYYNDFCYRVRYADIPYNLILSNLAFVLHGLILAANVLCMESEVFARCLKIAETQSNKSADAGQIDNEKLPDHALWCPDISLHLGDRLVPPDDIKLTDGLQTLSAEANKKKFSFSIPYAFAWALCFEGMYSALYHLCPSKLAFQFDTAFMFVMASLIVMLMYNGIEATPCTEAVHAKRRVGAANFFLFFLVPLFVFNYFGTIYHTEAGLTETISFSLCLFLWIHIMAMWVVYRLCPKKCIDCCKKAREDVPLIGKKAYEKAYEAWPKDTDDKAVIWKCCDYDYFPSKWVIGGFCVLGFLLAIVLIYLALHGSLEFANAFLYLCIVESALVAIGSLLTTCLVKDKTCNCSCIVFGVFLFGAVTIAIMGIALYFFTEKATTDKSKSPEKSRDLNEECDFFDDHDKWHILSSFGLFMGALMMIHVSYDSPSISQEPNPGRSNTYATEPI